MGIRGDSKTVVDKGGRRCGRRSTKLREWWEHWRKFVEKVMPRFPRAQQRCSRLEVKGTSVGSGMEQVLDGPMWEMMWPFPGPSDPAKNGTSPTSADPTANYSLSLWKKEPNEAAVSTPVWPV